MATAALSTRVQPIYNRKKEAPPMKTENNLQVIIEKVRQLQDLTRTTGFHTTRSVGMLLATLSPDELVEVSKALHLTPSNK
jgi:hypothetical protein